MPTPAAAAVLPFSWKLNRCQARLVSEHTVIPPDGEHYFRFAPRVFPAVSPTRRRRPVMGRPVRPDETRAVFLRLTAGSELRLRLDVMLL